MSHLRLIGGPKPPRKRWEPRQPFLTSDQHRAAKAALRGLVRARFGSQERMSEAIGMRPDTVVNALRARGRVSAEVLVRTALTCSIPVEQLITPGPRRVT